MKAKHTLWAKRCCCTPTAVAAPCLALESELEYDETDGKREERLLALIARCMMSERAQSLKKEGGALEGEVSMDNQGNVRRR